MIKKILLALLALAGFSLLLISIPALNTPNLLADEPETLEEARERQKQVERDQLATETEIDLVNAEDARISDAFNAAVILTERQEEKVQSARRRLAASQVSYERAQAELITSREQLAAIRARAKEMAVAAYLQIQVDQNEILLSSADINEGVRKRALIDLVSLDTGDFLDQIRLVEEDNRIAEDLADKALKEIQATEKELSEELKTLEADEVNLARIGRELDQRRARLEEQIAAFEQESEDIANFIRQKEQEERIRQLEGSDGYVWPLNAPVGGGFGPRFHPILKYWRPHNGLDIGGRANNGQPILAAHRGIVIASQFGKGFGNYVVLDHGDGTSSVYAHMSQRLVTAGEAVSAGTVLGNVGTTGLSTGPHLHFEIRENGKPVDPLKYLPAR